DDAAGFSVGSTTAAYTNTFSLSAGTHFLRTDFGNDPLKTSRSLTIANLNVAGASILNTNNNANALAAADTYIANYRQGAARLELLGVEPGTPVRVQLARHAFRFGTAVGGTTLNSVNSFLNNANYSNFLLDNFNTIVQGNAGKWAYNEATRNVVTMAAVDRFFQYAEQHGLDVRVHNMLWGDSQQPNWVNTLLNSAAGGSIAAKDSVRAGISNRIRYYVGDGNPATPDRASRYVEMDVINEHDHQPKYWNVYGVDGVAEIFNEAQAAIEAAGAPAKLYLNEYNVFQWGDSYGNWYRGDIEALQAAGGAIGGIGIQYYPDATSHPAAFHSPARMQQVLQNLSGAGLPISLTEFGVGTGNGATVEQAASFLTDTMRMMFGTPAATTFMMWGFWANDVWNQAPLAALVDANWNLTAAGHAYQNLMSQWHTDVELEVGPDGAIDFTGFYGDYLVTVGDQTFSLSHAKDAGEYGLVVHLAADFNDDGQVDEADLAVWQQRFNDGLADGADLLLWQQQLGLVASAPNSTAAVAGVPEPSAIVLAVVAGVGARLRRRSQFRHQFAR
ncbi:MAG TPA: endo-1,4-beta-xylanase, partial [Lacipirellulaceae bacterium]|nr:endo-1,4-beta-xylanase [Lacipirellulaceae bacterium]